MPVRQWVLTLPHRLRYRLAYDHRLCRAFLGVFARALLSFQRRRARDDGVVGRGGAVTAIQRCGSALNTNIHFHTLVAEGVFTGGVDSPLRFVPSWRPPDDLEVARLLARVRGRIIRLVRRHGIELEAESEAVADAIDPLFEELPGLAQIQGASVVGRVATGPRAGRWVVRLGRDPRAEVVIGRGRRQAHQRGFDLHADTAVGEGERDRLERLCRYVLRPPLAGDALELTEDGKVLLRLRRPWSDGTYAIRFEPSELLERLAAMIPRPRANQLIYHGAYAPRGVVHERACASVTSSQAEQGGRQPSPEGTRGTAPDPESPDELVDAGSAETAVSRSAGGTAARPPPETEGYVRPRHHAWADLLKRTFAVDVLDCPECGGRLRLLATITQREVIERILVHLGLPSEPIAPEPARIQDDLFA